MQSADKSQATLQSVANSQPVEALGRQANGPTPMSLDLLHFVGGGKGATKPIVTPSAPHNGW